MYCHDIFNKTDTGCTQSKMGVVRNLTKTGTARTWTRRVWGVRERCVTPCTWIQLLYFFMSQIPGWCHNRALIIPRVTPGPMLAISCKSRVLRGTQSLSISRRIKSSEKLCPCYPSKITLGASPVISLTHSQITHIRRIGASWVIFTIYIYVSSYHWHNYTQFNNLCFWQCKIAWSKSCLNRYSKHLCHGVIKEHLCFLRHAWQ